MTPAVTNCRHSFCLPSAPKQRACDPLDPRESATSPGPPAALSAVPREPLLPISSGRSLQDHTFDTLCGVGQASPLDRSPRRRLAHISSLGSGNFWHSGYILLCWALTGAGKEADFKDMPDALEHLWGSSDVPQPPAQLTLAM